MDDHPLDRSRPRSNPRIHPSPRPASAHFAGTLVRRGITSAETARAFLGPRLLTRKALPTTSPAWRRRPSAFCWLSAINELICIWGDFDVDGQTSTALLVQTLTALGADATYHIPIRAVSSHGVHIPELTEIIDRGANLILTCDTGITAHEAVDYAKSRGVDFVITDHHDPILIERRASDSEAVAEMQFDLPNAVAVVNPKLLPVEHPLANLAAGRSCVKSAEALLDQQTADHRSTHCTARRRRSSVESSRPRRPRPESPT